jgi:S-adenosylmethionine synthetase
MFTKKDYIFTSESVGIGHPDKVADQVSDAILDACLSQDPESRVAVETLVTTQTLVMAGEVTTNAKIDYEQIARDTVKKIGYTDEELGFDFKNMQVLVKIHSQSPDISQGVTEGQGLFKEQGAGDQGMMFGFASNETPEFMPLPITLSHQLVNKAKELRENKALTYLRPDCKAQVTILYEKDKPQKAEYIVLSLNHSDAVTQEIIRQDAIKYIIEPICKNYLTNETKILVNPTGRFVIGGPNGDTGVTGRKIIVDSYGGYARHGGGAFSGKDPSKVDRSAAYAARYLAKNIVAAGLCDKCEIQVSYAIGKAEPLNITLETFDTEIVSKEKIEEVIRKVFDLTPKGIITSLNLKKPIYEATAFGGHFGRNSSGDFFPWEKLDKVGKIREAVRNLKIN